jgi:hypothetical protein
MEQRFWVAYIFISSVLLLHNLCSKGVVVFLCVHLFCMILHVDLIRW